MDLRFGYVQSFCVGGSDSACPAAWGFLWPRVCSETVQLISLSFISSSPVSPSHEKRAVDDEFVLRDGSSSLFLPGNEDGVRALHAAWLWGGSQGSPPAEGRREVLAPMAPSSPVLLKQPCSHCSLAGSRVLKSTSLILRHMPYRVSALTPFILRTFYTSKKTAL